MPRRFAIPVALGLMLAGVAAAQSLPPSPVLTESPWNGDLVLSQTRNTAEIKAAADGQSDQNPILRLAGSLI